MSCSKNKIDKLTADQTAGFPHYIDKWLRIGLSTVPCDREAAKVAALDAYKAAGLSEPKIFIWLRSPFGGAIAANLLEKSSYGPNVRAQVWDQVGDQVWDQVWDQVGAQVWAQVGAQVWDQVGAQVRDQVRDQVGAQVWDQVRAQVWDQVRAQVGRAGYGSHDANWLAFYDFFSNECKIEDCERLRPLMRLAENCGWWWPFHGAVVFTEKPIEIHLNQNKKLHKDLGPAIKYADGFSVYALSGIRMPKEIVETPASEIDPNIILKEKNADLRREIVRKIGIAQVLEKLNSKTIDRYRDYELVLLDLGDGRRRPYLKMINPSIGVVHVEGVPPDINKVSDAIAWRNGLKVFKEPEVLT